MAQPNNAPFVIVLVLTLVLDQRRSFRIDHEHEHEQERGEERSYVGNFSNVGIRDYDVVTPSLFVGGQFAF